MSADTVLVIDDNHVLRNTLRVVLESEGFTVSCCEDGPSALELTNEKRYEIVLTDYHMPVLNGDEVVRQLRHRCPDAFIVGFSIDSKRQAFLDAGANAFIRKEMLIQNLIPLIKEKTKC